MKLEAIHYCPMSLKAFYVTRFATSTFGYLNTHFLPTLFYPFLPSTYSLSLNVQSYRCEKGLPFMALIPSRSDEDIHHIFILEKCNISSSIL